MRSILFPILSFSLIACASTASDDDPGRGPGGGGGKADEWYSGCPVDGEAEDVIEAIAQAGSCQIAANVASACAWGSSQDIAFVNEANQICSQNLAEMSETHAAAYSSLVDRCYSKWAGYDGTIYRSAEALCHLEVVKLFERLYPADIGAGATPWEPTCPAERGDVDAIVAAISEGPTCGDAALIAEACADGLNFDAVYAETASAACGLDLTAADAEIHTSLIDACDAKWLEDEDRPLDRSLSAFCKLQVDRAFDAILRTDDGEE